MNKKVVITGAGGRLGSKIAEEFVCLGARVVPVKFDAKEIKSLEAAVKKAAAKLGGLDILINSAGVFYRTPLDKTKPADWDEFMNVNLRAPFFLSKFAVPFLKKARPGRIINIADTYGVSPAAGFVPYGVSKAGLIAMTKGLAKELAPDVLVNCVCPGVIAPVRRQFGGRSVSDEAIPRVQLSSGDCFAGARNDKRAIDATLLKRPVRGEDVVDAVIFLARNESMTGQAIFVDCGGPSLRLSASFLEEGA